MGLIAADATIQVKNLWPPAGVNSPSALYFAFHR